MLTGTALKHYYTSIKPNPQITQLPEICENIRQTFEGAEFKRSMLTRWNNLTFQTIIDDNQSKNIETCLQLLIDELRTTQMSLPRNFQDDASLQNKLLTACQSQPSCSIACSTPANSSLALINNLRLSINTFLAVNKSTQQAQYNTSSNTTNRNINNINPNPNPNPNPNLNSNSNEELIFIDRKYHGQHNRHSGTSKRSSTQKCFICRKTGCWSSRHSADERARAREKFHNNFRKIADTRFDQYIAEFEGQEEDLGDISETEIEALIKETENLGLTDSGLFMTEAGPLNNNNA
ncbi:hypothetical protein K3495_g15865, partial [Podosphaera aphanis]